MNMMSEQKYSKNVHTITMRIEKAGFQNNIQWILQISFGLTKPWLSLGIAFLDGGWKRATMKVPLRLYRVQSFQQAGDERNLLQEYTQNSFVS